jgi:FkbM family methyltransferase
MIYGMGRGYFIRREFWLLKCLDVFLKLKPGAVIDVGANVGVYLVNLHTIERNREYYGFEPNPAGIFYLHELIRLNAFPNTYILPFALSDKKEIRTLFARKRGDAGASMHEFIKSDRDFSVQILTFQGDDILDSLDVDEIAVIKIDVEGAELEVLNGLKSTVEKRRPYIYCEIWPLPHEDDPIYLEKHRRLTEIYRLLMDMDYSVLGVVPDNRWEHVKSVSNVGEPYSIEYIFSPNEEMQRLVGELSLIRC